MASQPSSLPVSRQWLAMIALLALVCGALGLGYYWFLSGDYSVLAARVRPEQAAAIVEQLKKDNIRFKLEDGGTTILVPASEADAARLGIAGEDLLPKGSVGFELFNQSDMGLTDFAQKVNYQRALQGEIARTIMAMDGIAYARVHLALPERTLFRAASSEPRAAVTLTPEPGVAIDAGRIAGIQRLVAASVPDLALDQVAVLDEQGELLTPEFSDVPGAAASENAAETNYRSRILSVIAAVAPRAHVQVKVTLVPASGAAARSDPSGSARNGETRGNAIRIVLFERLPLMPGEQQAVRKAIEREIALDQARGDQLSFSPAPEIAAPIEAARPTRAAAETQSPPASSAQRFMADVTKAWTIALSLLLAGAAFFVLIAIRRRSKERRDALATRIRDQLLLAGGVHDAA